MTDFWRAGRPLEFRGVKVRLVDILLLGTTAVFSLITVFFPSRIEGRASLLLGNAAAVVAYLGASRFAQKSRRPIARFLWRTASVQFFFLYLYSTSLRLQHVFFSRWFDQAVLDFEQKLFGVQPTIWIQKFISPGLTEWMMFCYVFYVLVYPLLGAIIFFKHGEEEMEDYLFHLGAAIVISTFGFMLFPVASPIFAIGGLYNVPLRGYVFAAIGELVRNNLHVAGGAIPSIHCAAATIMWWSAYRYHRASFFILAPVILSLYVSTVYGRFHYLTDVIIGILVALLAAGLGRLFKQAVSARRQG